MADNCLQEDANQGRIVPKRRAKKSKSTTIATIAYQIVNEMKQDVYGTSNVDNQAADCTWNDVEFAIIHGINIAIKTSSLDKLID